MRIDFYEQHKAIRRTFLGAILGLSASALAAAGPVAWWSVDELSAPSAWVRDGKRGGAVQPGNSSYLKAGGLGQLQAVTVELWIRPDAPPADYTSLLSCDDWETGALHLLLLGDGRLQLAVKGGEPLTLDSRSAVGKAIGKWSHVAATYDATGKKTCLYINGRKDGESSLTAAVPVVLNSFRIGAWNREPRRFLGAVDEVRLYPAALSEDEVARVMAGENVAVKPVAWWKLDETEGQKATDASGKEHHAQVVVGEAVPAVLDRASGRADVIRGHFKLAAGVAGKALLFDGFTTRVVRSAAHVPAFGQGWAIEAWIAPQEYSWARTGLVDLDQDGKAGFCFSINYLGQIGLHASVDGQWQGCESQEPVPLLKWSHVAGTFDPEAGFRVYINGQLVGQQPIKGTVQAAEGLDLWIGMAHRKQYPTLTGGEPSKKFLSPMVFDGLIDEVKIYDRAPAPEEIEASFAANMPANPQPLQFRVLPSGPKKPRPFGAYYTRLDYCPEWDRIWRVGDFADVLVCFDELPVRMVFWRGTGYCPAWVTENGKWVGDQGPESWNQWGCCEQMSDKRCQYGHVRILENTEARVVVHWRTASPDITYGFNHVDPDTGWGEWTDEYYYIYPDAVAVRYQEIRSTWAAGMEWQQSELINQPGTRPQDNVELEAMTVVNMQGESETWSWEKPYGARAAGSRPIKDGNIQVMNLKAPQRHFVIGETGARWEPFGFGALEGYSTMACWNHWPVAQLPNDGRVTPAPDRPSSTCLGTLFPVKHKTGRPDLMVGRDLYGLTDQPPKALAVLARSWNFPAELALSGEGYTSQGYDPNQRAYLLSRQPSKAHQPLHLTLRSSGSSPVLNPALVVKHWGEAGARLDLQGRAVARGKEFRFGHRRTLEGTDLVVWAKLQASEPVALSLTPAAQP